MSKDRHRRKRSGPAPKRPCQQLSQPFNPQRPLPPLLPVIVVTPRLLISSPPSSSRIILVSVFVPDLSPTLPSSVLSPLGKALVQIRSDDPLVELRTADVLHAVERVLVRVVLHEAEAARRLLKPIQAHHESFDAAALGEEFVDLFFRCVEGAVVAGT